MKQCELVDLPMRSPPHNNLGARGGHPRDGRARLRRLANLAGGWALVVGIGLLVLSREVRWARGALVRLERFMRRHGMRTSLRRLIARRQRERGRRAHPSVKTMDLT